LTKLDIKNKNKKNIKKTAFKKTLPGLYAASNCWNICCHFKCQIQT